MDSTLVIKAKCGDTLRRFNVPIDENGQLGLNMSGLRAKILGLFNLPLDVDVILTYVDEDGDVVTLVDDDDLLDVMKQSLKFLRVDVHIKNTNNNKSSKSNASGASTPVRSPRVQSPLPNLNAGVADVIKSIPEPFRETLSKLSHDLASKAACSSPVVADIVDCFSKMGQSLLNQAEQSHVGTSSSTHVGNTSSKTHVGNTSSSTCVGDAENPMTCAVPFVANSQEMKVENVTRGVGLPTKLAPAPVDLNLDPPCDSNTFGCTTNNFAPAVDGNSKKKENKKRISALRRLGAECPFSGIPMVNDSPARPFILPPISPIGWSGAWNDPTVGIFHKGIQCDGCGALPITGPRYKSKVRENYDLCSICFSEMGNEDDYIKMDRPLCYRHPHAFRGLRDPSRWYVPPAHVMGQFGGYTKPTRGKLDSRFILDVNVLDGTMMAPSTPFTKIWRLCNSGTTAWPQGARLVWIGGDRFSHSDFVELEIPADGLPVDAEIDVAVDFTSPKLGGRYLSYWRMASPSGSKFGQRVWVLINVEASLKENVSDEVRGLNLNFPPDCSGLKCPEAVDVNDQPAVGSGIVEPCSSSSVSVPTEVGVDVGQPKKKQEFPFPINDSLLVGNGVSSPGSSKASPSVSYPIIDLSEVGLSEAAPAADVPTSSEDTNIKDVEKSLLKELEEMGFRQVDLNKEILRLNEYNLEQSLDDLCGVSEWDPILEELHEMGFRNEEMNRKLLKKNNGSIKGVVMDLLTGEKA